MADSWDTSIQVEPSRPLYTRLMMHLDISQPVIRENRFRVSIAVTSESERGIKTVAAYNVDCDAALTDCNPGSLDEKILRSLDCVWDPHESERG
jgi:hypothetical protein